MENMDKGITVPKYPKCPRIYLPNLSAQAQKFWISMKKGFLHWASVVRDNSNGFFFSIEIATEKSKSVVHSPYVVTVNYTHTFRLVHFQ